MDYERYLNYLTTMDPVYKSLIGIGALIPLIFGIFSWPFFVFIGAPTILKIYLVWSCGKTTSKKRLEAKVVIITGANVGIGYETVKDLAGRGANVIMACRNMEKGKQALGKSATVELK